MASFEHAPYVHNCYPIAVRSVRDAISVDQANDFKDAYRRYLACILSMIHALKDEAWDRDDLPQMGHIEAIKLLRLSDQCLSRASDILKEASTKHITSSPDKTSASRRYSQPPSPVSANISNRPIASRSASFDTNSSSNEQPKDFRATIMALPTPPGYTQTPTTPSPTYSSRYATHTKAINQAYQRRKTLRNESSIMQKYATANHNLSQLRKEAEMSAISKAKEKEHHNKIMERQRKMQIEAERRWNERRSHLQRDKVYRQNLLACILIFEEDQPWTKVLRQTLKQNKEKNDIIVSVVKAVLLNVKHPLHRVMIEIQQNLHQKLIPLVKEFADSRNLELPDNVYLEPVEENNLYYEQRYVTGPTINKKTYKSTNSMYEELSNTNRTDLSIKPNINNANSNSIDGADLSNINRTPSSVNSNTVVANDFSSYKNQDSISYRSKDTQSPAVEEKTRVTRISSLEAAFNDMEDEMFSSDSEDESCLENNENIPSGGEVPGPSDENTDQDIHSTNEVGTTISNKTESVTKELENSNISDNSDISPNSDNKNADTSNNDYDNYECSFCNENDDSAKENSTTRDSTSSIEENEYKVLTLTPSTNKFFYKQSEESDDRAVSSDYEDLNTTNKSSISDDYEQLTESNTPKPNTCRETCIPKIIEPIYEEIENVIPAESKEKSSTTVRSARRLSATSIGSDISTLIDTEFLKELDNIVQELLHGIDRLHSVLLLTYEDMDTPMGKDQSYAVLESLFFKPLWPWLITLFRKINWHKERVFEQNTTKYADVTPKDMKIREKFWLSDPEKNTCPYQTAIDEMLHLPTYSCPLEKLECIVRTSRLICIEVETYWNAKGEDKTPSLGCDDLLPIFSFVVLKSQLSQIVAECHAMEEFIHEGYLLGEEGYCLITLHAAISYLLTLE